MWIAAALVISLLACCIVTALTKHDLTNGYAVRSICAVSGFLSTLLIGIAWVKQHRQVQSDSSRELQALSLQLLEANERQRLIVEYADRMLLSISQGGTIEACNATAERMLGFGPLLLLSKPISSLLIDPDAKLLSAILAQRGMHDVELRMKHNDGRILDTQWHIEFSKSDERAYCVIDDVSDKRAFERMKQRLFAMLGHDLRVPLAAVRMNLSNLANDPTLPAEAREQILSTESSIVQVLRMTNDILDLQKAEDGRLNLKREIVSIPQLVQEIIGELKVMFDRKQQTVIMQCDEEVLALADEQRVRQVLLNLISNANKYAAERATIKVSTKQSCLSEIRVCVEDSGPGIPGDQFEVIFQPYVRVQKDEQPDSGIAHTPDSPAGTGLGLSLCKLLIEAQGGSIALSRSDELSGACFCFTLPAAEDNSSAERSL